MASARAGPGAHSGHHSHPARPTCTPRSSALRISHNPDPQHRRYPGHPPAARLQVLGVDAQEPSRWGAPPDERPNGDKHRRTLDGAETGGGLVEVR